MKKIKVVFIDDDLDFVEATKLFLEQNYEVFTAGRAEEGLELIRRHKPDIILTDLLLPGADGTEICRELKKDKETSHIPVILLTALGDKISFMRDMQKLGHLPEIEAYLSKPVMPENLMALIETVLKNVTDAAYLAARPAETAPGGVNVPEVKKGTLTVLLEEKRRIAPKPQFINQSNIKDEAIYAKAEQAPEKFWEGFAQEISWFRKWDRVLEWEPPFARWFSGGKLNVSYNCIDRHIHSGRRNKAAIIWEGENGNERVLTYWDLYREVNGFARVLNSLGVKKGDRVVIYLPLIPEAAIAMLACTRIGAVHSVVFAGFSAEALRDRINDSQAVVLITADGSYRRGNILPLKHDADYSLRETPSIKNVIVVKNGNFPIRMKEGRDHFWHRLMQESQGYFRPEPMDSEDMLFTLYTSGTTGKPKGIIHTTGGYLTGVYATTKWVFDLKEDDVFWCTADVGWITGHSYVVYGPLSNGATVMMYEGAPDWPERDRFWQLIEKYGITVFYTAPTAIRAFMKWGTEWPEKHNLSSLRLLGSVGEPINPEAWMWYYKNIGHEKCPVVDTWWQTETGMIMITPLAGITHLKPGSATKPFPGVAAEVLDEKGNAVPCGGGFLAIKKPWPAMLRGIYGDPERYIQQYWSKWDRGTYFTGDGCKRDEEGYYWLLGRVDDVMNVAGHRIGTMEVESALVDHPSVAEAAVVGIPHEIKGMAIVAFVILKEGTAPPVEKEQELKEHVVKKIGAIARPEKIIFTVELPKTRSGKIMRRLLRDLAEGRLPGDTTTLADASVVEGLRKKYEDKE